MVFFTNICDFLKNTKYPLQISYGLKMDMTYCQVVQNE